MRMRALLRESIWLNRTCLRLTALKSWTGMLTRPKLIDPLQMARGMAASMAGLPTLGGGAPTCRPPTAGRRSARTGDGQRGHRAVRVRLHRLGYAGVRRRRVLRGCTAVDH